MTSFDQNLLLIFKGILAFFLPPLAVFIHHGWHEPLAYNTILTFFGWVPGIAHAWYVLLKYPSLRG